MEAISEMARQLCPVWRTAAEGHHHDPCGQCDRAQEALERASVETLLELRRAETESQILREVAVFYREAAAEFIQAIAHSRKSEWARSMMADPRKLGREVDRRMARAGVMAEMSEKA